MPRLPLPAPRRPNVSNQGMIMRDNTTIIGGRATAKSSPDTGPNTSNQGVIMRNNSTIVSGRAIAKSSTDTSPAPTPKLPSVSAQTSTAQSDSGQPVKHQQRMADHASHQTFQGAQAKCDIVINTPEEGNITPTWTFYWGSCIVYPNANPERWFVARFEMQMAVSSIENSPTGTLHLAADGLPPRVHAVDKLNHPLLEGKCCILTTKGPVAEASYRLELKDQATTTLFARCLTGLQKTVVFYASKKKDSPTERALPTKKVSPTERASTTGKASPTDLTVEQSSVATSLVDINEPPGNSYATSTSQQAKSQVPESMRDFLKPITYSPETLQKFRGRAVLPAGTPWSPTAGKTNACWESEVWSGKSAVSAPGTSTTSTPSAPSQRRPKMGLSSSMYAN